MKATMKDLSKVVARRYNIGTHELTGAGRARVFSKPRSLFCWIARNHLGKSTTQIGDFLNRDHSTICYATQRAIEFGIDPVVVGSILNEAHQLREKVHVNKFGGKNV